MSSVVVQQLAEAGSSDAAEPRQLDSDMRQVLDAWSGLAGKPVSEANVPEARAMPSLEVAQRRLVGDAPAGGIEVTAQTIPGPLNEIRLRIYRPEGATGPRPVVVYFHGGIFVFGDIATAVATPRELVRRTGAIVISSHYRLAPESRFPAAHEDAWAVWNWVNDNAAELGGDPRRVAVVGEDAGGNLALNIALRARDTAFTVPLHVGLVSPMAAMLFELPSHRDAPSGTYVDTPALQWASRKLFRDKEQMRDARMNLAGRVDLDGLPPATVILARHDPLRSEGEALADALRRSGVWVDATVYEGVTHGFFPLYRMVNKALFAQAQLGNNLMAAFEG
jgi:acetyl esterase